MKTTDQCGMVSVIIPVFNRETMVEECIRSVYAQSCQNFEIILIDDGSTDNSLEICRSLAAADPRIKLLTSAHLGVSGARNLGLDSAVGEYIFFLDSDDIIHPHLLEALITGVESHGAKVAGTKYRGCPHTKWETGTVRFCQDTTPFSFTYHNPSETLYALFHGNSPLGMIGGVMMRSDLIGETRFNTDLFIGEDYYFIYENLIKGADAVFLDQSWYLNRLHANNTSWQYGFDGFWTRFHRRELVWKREADFGRMEYVNIQKMDALGCFIRCFKNNRPYSADGRKMREVLKKYRKEMFPAMGFRTKCMYLLYIYCPVTANVLMKVKLWLQKRNAIKKT